MIRRRPVAGLLLLCALLFSAFAAQSASATPGTTAFTCSSGAAIKDFSDAHCDSGTSEGSFGHIEVGPEQEVEIEITNAKTKNETKESTPAILKGTVFGVPGEITCTTVAGTGKSENVVIGEVEQNEGTNLAIKYTACTVNKPTNCKVKEPIEVTGSSITVENLGASKTEMGVEFKPKEKTLSEITFEGASCVIKGQTFKVEGSLVATGSRGDTEATTSSGGTLGFTNAMTKETLKLGGSAAEFSSTFTVNMKVEGEVKPLTLTTTKPEEVEECPAEPKWPEESCGPFDPTEKELEEAFKQEEECPAKKAGEASGHDPIVFVHGWDGDLSSLQTMRKTFKEEGWPAAWLCNFNYRWWKSNATTAERIQERVEKVLKETGAKKVDIVTHSMGAISSRYYIKEMKGAEKVKQWASLGAPNYGTLWASLCSYTSCVETRRGSTFLKALNSNPTPAGPKYATWRSGANFLGIVCDWVIEPPRSAELGGTADNKKTACLGHSELHEDATVFKQVREFVEK